MKRIYFLLATMLLAFYVANANIIRKEARGVQAAGIANFPFGKKFAFSSDIIVTSVTKSTHVCSEIFTNCKHCLHTCVIKFSHTVSIAFMRA
jgi:hypothetical protein